MNEVALGKNQWNIRMGMSFLGRIALLILDVVISSYINTYAYISTDDSGLNEDNIALSHFNACTSSYPGYYEGFAAETIHLRITVLAVQYYVLLFSSILDKCNNICETDLTSKCHQYPGQSVSSLIVYHNWLSSLSPWLIPDWIN